MTKQTVRIIFVLLAVALLLLGLVACGKTPDEKNPGNPNPQGSDVGDDTRVDDPTSPAPGTDTEPDKPAGETGSDPIAKITGASDKTGIYAIVVTLKKGAADKGVVELVYQGAKGSPQENDVVNTFRIEYEKQADGTYEIKTFFDGEVYQNYYHKTEVKVVNEFGANLRAGNVIVTYTPEGGETQEIFRADADDFYHE